MVDVDGVDVEEDEERDLLALMRSAIEATQKPHCHNIYNKVNNTQSDHVDLALRAVAKAAIEVAVSCSTQTSQGDQVTTY